MKLQEVKALEQQYSRQFLDLISQMLEVDTNLRPNFTELYESMKLWTEEKNNVLKIDKSPLKVNKLDMNRIKFKSINLERSN